MSRGKDLPWRRTYRLGLTPEESETIRLLRARGYAVVFITPLDLGDPLARVEVEQTMLQAGKRKIKKARQP